MASSHLLRRAKLPMIVALTILPKPPASGEVVIQYQAFKNYIHAIPTLTTQQKNILRDALFGSEIPEHQSDLEGDKEIKDKGVGVI